MSQGPLWNLRFFDSELGTAKTYVQTIEDTKFLIHCHKDDKYVCKIMSTHGLMTTVENHTTYRYVGGEWKSFKYCEPMSRHNHAKHWVDDINNRRHDPIGLEEVWATKWWPHRQFFFHLFDCRGQCLEFKGQKEERTGRDRTDFLEEVSRANAQKQNIRLRWYVALSC
jgi:hypothetical protein